MVAAVAACAAGPTLRAPPSSSRTILSTVQLSWDDDCPVRAFNGTGCSYVAQVASDPGFKTILDEMELPAAISRFVPSAPLPPRAEPYYWRAGTVEGSQPPSFSVPWLFYRDSASKTVSLGCASTMEEIQAGLAAASREVLPTLVAFPACPSPLRLHVGNATSFVNLTDTSELVIDGGGNTFVFDAAITYISTFNVSDVEIRGMTMDMDPLPYTAHAIEEVDQARSRFSGRLLPGHPPMGSNPAFAGWRAGGMWVNDTQGVHVVKGAKEVVPAAWVNGTADPAWFTLPPALWEVSGVKEGHIFVIQPRQMTGTELSRARNLILRDWGWLAASNEGFTSWQSSGIAMLNVSIRLVPGRVISSNNGGHNHHVNRPGLWIADSHFGHTGDDIFNANGHQMVLKKVEAPDTVVLAREPANRGAVDGDLALEVGDRVRFFDPVSATVLGEARVVSFELDRASLETRVRFDGPAAKGSTPGSTLVFDVDNAAAQTVVVRTRFLASRRFGVLAHGDRYLVQDNEFRQLGGSFFCGHIDPPTEGLFLSRAVVRRNLVVNPNLLLPGSPSNPNAATPVDFYTTLGKENATRDFVDMLITQNDIRYGPGPVFSVNEGQRVLLSENNITRCASDASPLLVTFDSSASVVASGNHVTRVSDPDVC